MRPLCGPLTPESTDRVSVTVGPEPNTSTTNAVPGYSDRANTTARPAEAATQVDNNTEAAGSTDRSAAEVTQPEPEVKSEASYDPLFDDEPEADVGQSDVQPKPEPSNLVLPTNSTQPNGITTASQKPSVQAGLAPPPKKPTIPMLDPVTYGEYSSDILLAASIDGQVVLWDRRAQTHGGVGRLEMSEKCPPWCLSVRALSTLYAAARRNCDSTGLLVA
jgi:transcriptional activator SPT8